MPIIGNDSLTGIISGPSSQADPHRLLKGSGFTRIAVAGESVTSFSVYNRAYNVTNQIEVGVYDISAGENGAPLVGSATINGGELNTWATYTLPTPIALVSGKNYALAFRIASANFYLHQVTSTAGTRRSSGSTGTTPLQSTFSSGSEENLTFPIYATTTISIVANIQSVTSPVLAGSTGNALNTANFAGDLTSIAIQNNNGAFFSACQFSGSGDNYTFSVASPLSFTVDTLGFPLTSASHSLNIVASRSGESDNKAITVNPESGCSLIELNNVINSEGYLFHEYSVLPENTCQLYYESTYATIGTDGLVYIAPGAGDIKFALFDISDGRWKPGWIVVDGVRSGGLLQSGRITRKITSKLTSRIS